MVIQEIALQLLAVFTLLSLGVSLLVFAYHALLAIVAWLPIRRRTHSKPNIMNKFAIAIPAHNEEQTLPLALESCQCLAYPKEYVDIYVVADNCSDRTADAARSFGAKVLVRNDLNRRGKGYALQFAFDHILDTGIDVICVLDADCTLDQDALNVANAHLNVGATVLQCSYKTDNCDANAISLLLGVANALENDLFCAPKSRLGLYVPLRGTGMFITKSVLNSYPWNATGVVEDTEYSLQLALAGTKVNFLPNTTVRSAFPNTHRQLAVQRNRWLAGGMDTLLQHTPHLLRKGLRRRSIHLIDAAFSPLLSTRPLIVMQLLLTLTLGIVLAVLGPHELGGRLTVVSTVIILTGYILYVAIGFLNVGCTRRRWRLLLRSPPVLAHYLWLSIKSLLTGAPEEWIPTPRSARTSRDH